MKAERIDFNHYVSTVAHRWADQYYRNGKWGFLADGSSERVYLDLLAKGSGITVEQAEDIIRNGSWTGVRCDGCEKLVKEDVVSVGEAAFIDCSNCKLCKACVLEALAAFDEVNHDKVL